MKVLAIGNSFSEDAMRYLHRLAKSDGFDMETVNLYIGGCPLDKHYSNILSGECAYEYQHNGERTGRMVSLEAVLMEGFWDIITLQQESRKSIDFKTYQPYLTNLYSFVKEKCPQAKIMLHQTWAYETGSERIASIGLSEMEEMFSLARASYLKAGESLGGVDIIPSGEAMMKLHRMKIGRVHRDTFHASLGIGRYTVALTWYEALTGRSAVGNKFRDFEEPVSEKQAAICQNCADDAVKEYRA